MPSRKSATGALTVPSSAGRSTGASRYDDPASPAHDRPEVIVSRYMDDPLQLLKISPDDSLRHVLEAIDSNSCEIVVATDPAGRLVGVLSDGDVRRALLAGATLDTPAQNFVQRSPHVVGPSVPRDEVLDLMQARSISQVPVVDEHGHFVGIHLMRELLGQVPRPNWAVILAGGRGTRLAPLTDHLPKPMVKVAGRPILERLVLHLVGCGIQDVMLSVNYLADAIHDHFGDGERFGCRIHYIHEDRPLGTAGPLALIDDEQALAHPLLVLNGDLVTQFAVPELLEHHEFARADVSVAARAYSHKVPFGVLDVRPDGTVHAVREKPIEEWIINAGVYVVDPAALQRIPKDREYTMTSLIQDVIDQGDTVSIWTLDDDWHDIGRPPDLRAARGEA